MRALPAYFASVTAIEGLQATDLFTLNTVLDATIEVQVVETLNRIRDVWDPDAGLEPAGLRPHLIASDYDELAQRAHTVLIHLGDETFPVRCAAPTRPTSCAPNKPPTGPKYDQSLLLLIARLEDRDAQLRRGRGQRPDRGIRL